MLMPDSYGDAIGWDGVGPLALKRAGLVALARTGPLAVPKPGLGPPARALNEIPPNFNHT